MQNQYNLGSGKKLYLVKSRENHFSFYSLQKFKDIIEVLSIILNNNLWLKKIKLYKILCDEFGHEWHYLNISYSDYIKLLSISFRFPNSIVNN